MHRIALLTVFLAIVFSTSVAAQPTVSVRGNVGAAFFQSPEGLDTVLNSGVNLGLGAGVEVYRGLEIVVQGSYDRFTFNGDNFALLSEDLPVGSEVDGGALNVLNATLGLRYTFQNPSDAHPYVAGGGGLYRSVLEQAYIEQRAEPLPRQATTGKGFHAAVGTNFHIDETYSFFFEPRLVIVDTAGSELDTNGSTRYVTLRIGLDMTL